MDRIWNVWKGIKQEGKQEAPEWADKIRFELNLIFSAKINPIKKFKNFKQRF